MVWDHYLDSRRENSPTGKSRCDQVPGWKKSRLTKSPPAIFISVFLCNLILILILGKQTFNTMCSVDLASAAEQGMGEKLLSCKDTEREYLQKNRIFKKQILLCQVALIAQTRQALSIPILSERRACPNGTAQKPFVSYLRPEIIENQI